MKFYLLLSSFVRWVPCDHNVHHLYIYIYTSYVAHTYLNPNDETCNAPIRQPHLYYTAAIHISCTYYIIHLSISKVMVAADDWTTEDFLDQEWFWTDKIYLRTWAGPGVVQLTEDGAHWRLVSDAGLSPFSGLPLTLTFPLPFQLCCVPRDVQSGDCTNW